jgi:hypothetical protein
VSLPISAASPSNCATTLSTWLRSRFGSMRPFYNLPNPSAS